MAFSSSRTLLVLTILERQILGLTQSRNLKLNRLNSPVYFGHYQVAVSFLTCFLLTSATPSQKCLSLLLESCFYITSLFIYGSFNFRSCWFLRSLFFQPSATRILSKLRNDTVNSFSNTKLLDPGESLSAVSYCFRKSLLNSKPDNPTELFQQLTDNPTKLFQQLMLALNQHSWIEIIILFKAFSQFKAPGWRRIFKRLDQIYFSIKLLEFQPAPIGVEASTYCQVMLVELEVFV